MNEPTRFGVKGGNILPGSGISRPSVVLTPGRQGPLIFLRHLARRVFLKVGPHTKFRFRRGPVWGSFLSECTICGQRTLWPRGSIGADFFEAIDTFKNFVDLKGEPDFDEGDTR